MNRLSLPEENAFWSVPRFDVDALGPAVIDSVELYGGEVADNSEIANASPGRCSSWSKSVAADIKSSHRATRER